MSIYQYEIVATLFFLFLDNGKRHQIQGVSKTEITNKPIIAK